MRGKISWWDTLFLSLTRGQERLNVSVTLLEILWGTYSYWASLAVAHYYLFFYLSNKYDSDFASLKYVILGDYVLIGDKDIGEAYLQLISDLGIRFSKLKTHKSKTTYEFAKRWINNVSEVTPFPISSLKESGRRYYLLTNLLLQEEMKGWKWVNGIPAMAADFHGRFLNLPSSFRKKIEKKVTILKQMMLVIWGVQTAGDGVNAIIRYLNLPLPHISD